MAVVPLIFRNWWDDDFEVPMTSRILDQHFGTALSRDDLLSSVWGGCPTRTRTGYRRPWQRVLNGLIPEETGSTVQVDKDKFQVILDVQQFAPNEVKVKIADRCVLVEGKHEEKQDEHGYISRQFSRRYLLPDGVNPEAVTSQLSSDGLLTIVAPMKQLAPPQEERAIPITQTGQPLRKEEPKKIQKK